MPISSAFQKRLNDLIEDTEKSRTEVAKVSQVNPVSLSHALVYGIVPSTTILLRLADFFNVSLPYLLGETDTNEFIKAESPTTFQARFEELCKEHNLSHYKVSQKCYFDKSNISRWLSKGYLPALEILNMLCKLFNVSADYLLGRTDYRN